MQRAAIILAYLFFCVNCFAQQYPFVHYTPKDGLISNQIKNIYQDSKGRLYFTSVNGLSIYDGSRFINYTSKNGLGFDIVNCVMDMGGDSVWIVTNSNKINCLVNGKLKTLALKSIDFVINGLCKDEKGDLYAATEQGLYVFDKDHFTKLVFTDTKGNDINSYIAFIFPVGSDYLLIQRDYSLLADQNAPLYLYNKKTQKTTAEIPKVFIINGAPDGRIWISTEKKIMAIDTTELPKGKIILRDLPDKYAQLKNLGRYFVFFDRENNCWLGDQSRVLIKAAPDGTLTSFTTASGLSMSFINFILQDREGITWIATNNAGVNKLVHSNFSFTEKPFDISSLNDISYNENKNELLLYSSRSANAAIVRDGKKVSYYNIKKASEISRLVETSYGFFGFWENIIYKMVRQGNMLYPEIILRDTNTYGNFIIDKNNSLVVCGKYSLTAIAKGKTICRRDLDYLADHPVLDREGNIWVAIRAGKLIMYQPRPDDPSNYLEQKLSFSKELSGISPRSIIIDKNDDIWIGTRSHGIHIFTLKNGSLAKKFTVTTASGLSDDFISHLACDADNNIWACSPLGLDKIIIKNGVPVVENLTKQNNIYQTVFKVVIDKNNTAWGLVSNGLIKITTENKPHTDYSPTLMMSMIKAGKDTIFEASNPSLSHDQNNLSFHFAATSFVDEKQVLYSYRLQGGSNNQWSEPTNNSSVSFIDLRPGNYTLHIKASFPAGRYPDKIIQYRFSILPPWWQTWWFRSIAGLLIVGLLISVFRFYYKRKLERQMAVLEKQQAIEKERARIATDMHDDLGAGLTRIKFITESLEEMTDDEALQPQMKKLKSSSTELVEKMAEIIWAMNEKNNTLDDLIFYLRSYAVEYCNENKLICEFIIPENIPPKNIGGQTRRNVFLILKESLHNIVKHADAKKVIINMKADHKLSLLIADDGRGFEQVHHSGNGLLNMQTRAKALSGKLSVSNKIGTTISLEIPL